MGKEASIIVRSRATQLNMMVGEIRVDDVKVSGDANAVEINRPEARGVFTGNISKVAGNQGASENTGSVVGAEAGEQRRPH
jgi:hypothetical protein